MSKGDLTGGKVTFFSPTELNIIDQMKTSWPSASVPHDLCNHMCLRHIRVVLYFLFPNVVPPGETLHDDESYNRLALYSF